MQDRFKFKVKFKTDDKIEIFDVIDINFESQQVFFRRQDGMVYNIGLGVKGAELIQCTGLKDKNGKLIYEGDVLALQQFKDDNVVHICFRCEETAEYLYEPIIKGDKKAPLLGIEEFAQTTEYMFEDKNDIPIIIGNIYENPELLEGGE